MAKGNFRKKERKKQERTLVEEHEDDIYLNGFMLHLCLYKPKQHVIISYIRQQREMTVDVEKNFNSLTLLRGDYVFIDEYGSLLSLPRFSSSSLFIIFFALDPSR